MKRTINQGLLVPGLTLLLMTPFLGMSRHAFAQPASPEAARKEGKVVVYGTIVPQIMSVIQKGFEAKYGIKIDYWRADATKVIDRALTEWRAGRPGFDVVTGTRGALLLLKQENVFAKYVSASADNFPARFRDKDALLTAWRVTPIGVLYNTELVKPGEIPRSLDDLLDARWQGKIAMPDPSQHASTAQFLWNLEKLKGDKWRDFVKALAKQRPHMMEAFSPIPAAVIRGEALLGITYLQYVVQQKGPLGYVPFDRYLTDPTDIGLSVKAADSNAGKVFIDYICSAEGQKRVAETGEFVLSPGIFPAVKEAEKISSNMVFMDNPTEEQLQELQSEFRQLFFAR